MKKTTLFLAIMFTASFVGAAEITPENPSNVTLDPGEEVTQDFEINFEDNDTEVRVAATDTGDYDVSYNSFRIFEDDGTFSADIQAPDKGNYTHNVTFSFEVEREGNLSSQSLLREVQSTTRIPYETLQEPTWVNQSYQLNANGEKLNVSSIETNLYFNNNSVQLSGTRTFNDVRLNLIETIPGAYAKIKADTKSEDATFSLKQVSQPKEPEPEPCSLGIRTITTLQRGNSFAIETIDQNSENNDVIGGVSVTLIDSGKGEPIGNTESGASGYASVFIPEDTKGPVVARLAKPEEGCDSNNQRVSFNRPYNVYINNNEQFQLNLQLDNNTFYGDMTGTVKNEESGNVGTGIVQITKPNGQNTDVAFNKSGFSYTPESAGEYSFKATKDGYVDSDKKTARFIADQDEDGIPNSQDECPETEGVEANNGCPKKEVYFAVYKDGQRYTDQIRPNQKYTIKILDQNQSVVDYDGELPVGGTELSIPFEDGVSKQGDTNNVVFTKSGDYELSLNESAYEPASTSLQVQNKDVLEGVPVVPIILGILILIGGGGLIWLAANSGGGGGSNTQPSGKYSYDLNKLDNGGGN